MPSFSITGGLSNTGEGMYCYLSVEEGKVAQNILYLNLSVEKIIVGQNILSLYLSVEKSRAEYYLSFYLCIEKSREIRMLYLCVEKQLKYSISL